MREALLREAIAIGRRFGDPDIEFEALAYLGGVFLMTDRVEEGLVLFDEALAAVCAGELTELATVDSIFCGFFWACELVNDVPRADQWMRAAAELMQRQQRRRRLLPRPLRRHPDRGRALGRGGDRAGRGRPALRPGYVAAARRPRSSAWPTCASGRAAWRRPPSCSTGLEQHPDAVRTLAALHLARGETALARDLLERATDGSDDEVPTVGESTMIGPAARAAGRRPPGGGRRRRRRPGRRTPRPHRRGAARAVPQGGRRAGQGTGLRRQRAGRRARLPARGAGGVRAGAAADGARADASGAGAGARRNARPRSRSPRRRRRCRTSSGWRPPGTPTPPARCCGRSAPRSGPAPRGSAR